MAGQGGLVSVVIPAFNAAEFIGEALKSVHDQTYRPIEVVVVNDGSTDSTASVVDAFATKSSDALFSVRRIDVGVNKGVANAQFTGFSQSHGDFVCWLSADDMYVGKEKLRLQVERMKAENALWSYYRDSLVGPSPANARVMKPLFPLNLPLFKGMLVKNPSFRLIFLLFRTPINGSTVMISRECIDKYGQFDPSRRNFDSDGDLWLRYSALDAGLVVLEGAPVFYREHGGQASHKTEATTYDGNLTKLRVLKALERRGLLPRLINDFFIWFPFVLRPDVYRYRPMVIEHMFSYVLGHPDNFNRTTKWYARRCLRKLAVVKDPIRVDRDKLLADLETFSQSDAFKDFEKRLMEKAQTK